jgi:TolB protein
LVVYMADSPKNGSGTRSSRRRRSFTLSPAGVLLLLLVNLIVILLIAWPFLQVWYDLPVKVPWSASDLLPDTSTPEWTKTPPPDTSTPTLTPSATASATMPVVTIDPQIWEQGVILLGMVEGLDSHLFAYQPLVQDQGLALPLTRLISGPWDDLSPALSPDKTDLAFASNRDGQWDIYLLDLELGKITQFTDTPDYEDSPSWSPDGLWLTYESYVDGNLDIIIRALDGAQEPIRLTHHLAADYAPTWSPLGRQIAFISTRGGRDHLWLADLDKGGEDRFSRISRSAEIMAKNPTWSPDGRFLTWAAITEDGLHKIYLWDSSEPGSAPREVGSGDCPVWSPDGQTLLTTLETPYTTYLTAYHVHHLGMVVIPPLQLPGEVEGLLWEDVSISGDLGESADWIPEPLWLPVLTAEPGLPTGRQSLVPLSDVEAPYPQLHDMVDESYQALREQLARDIGWDLLASLENAYVPLTSALAPGMTGDWLYTGRAFTLNTLPVNAGWMTVVREDYGAETFWQVYLRARFQDGSQGRPLRHLPWDFQARYSGDPKPYEQGGEIAGAVPAGYWVDLTRLAAAYGWERLPALSTWRVAYPAARFNEFVLRDGLDWEAAMLEIYPLEVLLTPTPVPTVTQTPTRTPPWYRSPTPTLTETPSPTIPPTRIIPTVP